MDAYKELVDFIYQHEDWRKILSEKPYSINIKNNCPEHPDWYLFKYNQIDTDFSYNICKACRGVVLDIQQKDGGKASRVRPVCVPFKKFFNAGEPHAENLDWGSKEILVEDKRDGCLVKLSKYEGETHWFTNGSMDTYVGFADAIGNDAIADKDVEPGTKDCHTFQDLIDYAVKKHNAEEWVKNIPEGVTYMLELTSPRSRIIVPYSETDLTLLAIYYHSLPDPNSWYEVLPEESSSPFKIPERYSCRTLEETVEMLKGWKGDKEGIVACELPAFRRVKIKSGFYLSLKYMKGEVGFTPKRIFEAIQEGSIDDAVAAWKEIAPAAEKMKAEIESVKSFIRNVYEDGKMWKMKTPDKKAFAEVATATPYPSLLFEAYSGRTDTLDKVVAMEYSRFQKLQALKDGYNLQNR